MRIFANKNFTMMFIGRIVTNVGDSLYSVAMMWLVYELGGSTIYTGIAGFLSVFPRVIQFFSGPYVDKLPVRSLLVYSQIIQAVLLLCIPIAAYFQVLTVTILLVVTPILSTLNMIVYPAQMAALPLIVKEEDLTKGNSLFSFAYQGIDLACNAISGILIVVIGAVSIYYVNAVTFFIGAIIFSFVRLRPVTPKQKRFTSRPHSLQMNSYFHELKAGIGIILMSPLARIFIGIILLNLINAAVMAVLPEFVSGADMYGAFLTALAAGSLIGALITPYLKLDIYPLGYIYGYTSLVAGIIQCAAIIFPYQWLALLLFGLSAIPGSITNIIIFSVIQKVIPQNLLGRVFAATFSISGIAAPLGGLAGGVIGVYMAGSLVIFLGGLLIMVIGLFWLLDPKIKKLPSPEQIDSSILGGKEKGKV